MKTASEKPIAESTLAGWIKCHLPIYDGDVPALLRQVQAAIDEAWENGKKMKTPSQTVIIEEALREADELGVAYPSRLRPIIQATIDAAVKEAYSRGYADGRNTQREIQAESCPAQENLSDGKLRAPVKGNIDYPAL